MIKTITMCDVCHKVGIEKQEQTQSPFTAGFNIPQSDIISCPDSGKDLCEKHHKELHDAIDPLIAEFREKVRAITQKMMDDNEMARTKVVELHNAAS